jgi:hypothetical protein
MGPLGDHFYTADANERDNAVNNGGYVAEGTAFWGLPGDAIYVPVKAPHWVRNGPEPSISLSITWRSEWSYHKSYAHGFNRMLRRAGLRPASPRPFPHRNLAKSAAYRALCKALRLEA